MCQPSIPKGEEIWIADAHGYGNRFIVRADKLLTAFVELQRGDALIRREFDIVMASAETWEIRLATKICGRDRAAKPYQRS